MKYSRIGVMLCISLSGEASLIEVQYMVLAPPPPTVTRKVDLKVSLISVYSIFILTYVAFYNRIKYLLGYFILSSKTIPFFRIMMVIRSNDFEQLAYYTSALIIL